MQYRTVPKNGDRLSALGFGAMRLPSRGLGIDEKHSISLMRYAIDNGVNYFDTAVPYRSEKILGKTLLDGYRDKVKVATKLTPFMLNKPEDMGKMLDIQLQSLQTDRIDYYLLHGLAEDSWTKFKDYAVLKFLDNAKAEGKIVNTGFSFHGSLTVFKEIVDAYDWAMCQIQYNFLDESLQAGTQGLKYAASKNLAVVVMEPLRGGMLAGKLPKKVAQIYNESGLERSGAEWALRWVWNHPEVTVVLSGMSNEIQVAENLKTAETALPGSMSQGELATVGKVSATFRRLMKVPCTGCNYCMPCPHGVNIPINFQSYNQYYMSGSKFMARAMYAASLMGAMHGKATDASLCISCGECVKRCPQHIAIPEELKKVNGKLGNWQTKLIVPVVKRVLPKSPVKDD
jgi:hypothetical protein